MIKGVLLVSTLFLLSQAYGDTCGTQTCPPSSDGDRIYCCEKGPYEWANELIQNKDEGCCDLPSKIVNWIQAHFQTLVIVAAVVLVLSIALCILSICCSWCCCCC